MRITKGINYVNHLNFVFSLFSHINFMKAKSRKMLLMKIIDKRLINISAISDNLKPNSLLNILEQETLWLNNIQIIFIP